MAARLRVLGQPLKSVLFDGVASQTLLERAGTSAIMRRSMSPVRLVMSASTRFCTAGELVYSAPRSFESQK